MKKFTIAMGIIIGIGLLTSPDFNRWTDKQAKKFCDYIHARVTE